MHLTNNSVAKHSEKFYSQSKYQNNMMSMQEFASYVSPHTNFYTKIQTQMKMQVISSLKSVQGTI